MRSRSLTCQVFLYNYTYCSIFQGDYKKIIYVYLNAWACVCMWPKVSSLQSTMNDVSDLLDQQQCTITLDWKILQRDHIKLIIQDAISLSHSDNWLYVSRRYSENIEGCVWICDKTTLLPQATPTTEQFSEHAFASWQGISIWKNILL